MRRRKFIVLGAVVSLVGLTSLAAAQQLNYQHGITQSSEQRVRCGRTGCASVTPRAGCRRAALGGMFGSNNFKVVCDQKK
jgi:hypothetical protein